MRHQAGYGTKLDAFRRQVIEDLSWQAGSLQGQGVSVAVFDSGLDIGRSDVFGDRLKDFHIGSEKLWQKGQWTLDEFRALHSLEIVAGLEAQSANPSLRITSVSEEDYSYWDLNGSGAVDAFLVATYIDTDGSPHLKLSPFKGIPFGAAIKDFGEAAAFGDPATLDIYTGQPYEFRSANRYSALGVKFRLKEASDENSLEFALVGISPGGSHGIANLHMVGGEQIIGRQRDQKFSGVAPKVDFLMMQSWENTSSSNYGQTWIPLARTMISATEAGADILDLDIYTPGAEKAGALLNELTCRLTAQTDIVPVVAVHNFAPASRTIQNLAQSPCVIAVGASMSKAGLEQGYGYGVANPRYQNQDDVFTAYYSGRGFSKNGTFKPDIISPAYAYTASSQGNIRFGGTSGATPMTAGAVALLKQAAKALGVSLDVETTRAVLQAGAKAPDFVRDGYGYLNLEKSWAWLKKLSSQEASPDRLRVDVKAPDLQFYEFPDQRNFDISLRNIPVLGGPQQVTPMTFWIEFPGSSQTPWLNFNSPDGQVSTKDSYRKKNADSVW